LVSVIMPTYNCAEYVDEALASVPGSRLSEQGVIVVDDRSSDGTVERVESYANRHHLHPPSTPRTT
jgi:glycosyltransferase involved in cell wall biosynthesis